MPRNRPRAMLDTLEAPDSAGRIRRHMTQGRLIYLMGPAGAGKDSVLRYARAQLDGSRNLVVAHRYITRPPEAGHENYVALSDGEFDLRLRKNLFLLDWKAHGLRYAVGAEVDLWRAAGLAVVVSGSREHFARAMSAYPGVLPVLIEASAEQRRERLLRRNRESAADIAERLERASAIRIAHPELVRIDNSGRLELAGNRLVTVLTEAAT